ncbi:hypothetical protein MUK70_04545 [Dyadobacter chenwenxiniae]|uniref:Uncharacterized protein n=1 Tax=Dyadobacter chenwenxiniae TaxID=2906456 RepID=A0A9X1PQQ1_9BACT|nr:hypothetical protein [Dyadobacter chenwenxiniae]MCF0049110.1 hypothetical protein [Dyadobacter chenwenxiniae]MCF0064684.1 hypothetical protein [Dyadobacter chenwenxiniae]UON84262.1 hypothetical protein MUK70_04545 [Dyadobacter chenwenxiniae]
MTHEKTLILQTGRCVKVISQWKNPMNPGEIEIDVLIKDPSETHYRPPIGLTHPKYWKLKRMGAEKSKQLQIQYSGLTEKQLRSVVKEFRLMQN